ncbi:MAG: hypothetical protein ABIL09_14090 [Gemmatimonadota bacterium]
MTTMIRQNDESYSDLGHRLWQLAGLDTGDINRLTRGGRMDGAYSVAGKLYEAGHRCEDVDGKPLSMASLISLWLQS